MKEFILLLILLAVAGCSTAPQGVSNYTRSSVPGDNNATGNDNPTNDGAAGNRPSINPPSSDTNDNDSDSVSPTPPSQSTAIPSNHEEWLQVFQTAVTYRVDTRSHTQMYLAYQHGNSSLGGIYAITGISKTMVQLNGISYQVTKYNTYYELRASGARYYFQVNIRG